MPQLDFLIVLPQIFWLIVFFSLFYFILAYFFLPILLRTILVRNKTIQQNYSTELKLTKEVTFQRHSFLKKLNFTFLSLHSSLFIELLHLNFLFFEKPFKQKNLILNKKIFFIIKKSFYFCNFIILNNYNFYPTFLK